MNLISDPDFGELCLSSDEIWTGQCEVLFFAEVVYAELVVQTFDDDPISQVQRAAFREFDSNKALICQRVEQALFDFYAENIERYRACFHPDEVDVKAPELSTADGLRELLVLRCVKVMFNFDGDGRDIGFVFDATFDPELGIGVLVTNGFVSTVDVQDFLLG